MVVLNIILYPYMGGIEGYMNCPALISDESAGLSDADCLCVCLCVCLSVCLQLYALRNRKSDRSEILGHDLVVSKGVQSQISSKLDHQKGVFTLLRSGLRKFQPFPHIYYCALYLVSISGIYMLGEH